MNKYSPAVKPPGYLQFQLSEPHSRESCPGCSIYLAAGSSTRDLEQLELDGQVFLGVLAKVVK